MKKLFWILLLPVIVLLAVLLLVIPRIAVQTVDPVFELPDEDGEETVYVLPFKDELAGEYVLTALSSDELSLTESDLAPLRERGIPLGIMLGNDGTASLSVFDTRIDLAVDPDAMLLTGSGQSYPFFYKDGILTVWDSASRAEFQKCK